MELLRGKNLLNRFKKMIPAEQALKNKQIVIFFFSAGWCRSSICRQILTKLKEVHKENLRRNIGLEVIYVSSDTNEEEFEGYYKTQGGWFAVHYSDDLAEQLRRIYGVINIPTLVVIRKNGDVITRDGRQEIIEKGVNVLVCWTE